jgi:hypothetical protein
MNSVSDGPAAVDDSIPTLAFLRSRRESIIQTAAMHGASNIRIFGSVARGTAEPGSDIDMLVDLETGRSLLDQVRLWRALESLLGRSVDVVSAGGLTERDHDIQADAVAL